MTEWDKKDWDSSSIRDGQFQNFPLFHYTYRGIDFRFSSISRSITFITVESLSWKDGKMIQDLTKIDTDHKNRMIHWSVDSFTFRNSSPSGSHQQQKRRLLSSCLQNNKTSLGLDEGPHNVAPNTAWIFLTGNLRIFNPTPPHAPPLPALKAKIIIFYKLIIL